MVLVQTSNSVLIQGALVPSMMNEFDDGLIDPLEDSVVQQCSTGMIAVGAHADGFNILPTQCAMSVGYIDYRIDVFNFKWTNLNTKRAATAFVSSNRLSALILLSLRHKPRAEAQLICGFDLFGRLVSTKLVMQLFHSSVTDCTAGRTRRPIGPFELDIQAASKEQPRVHAALF